MKVKICACKTFDDINMCIEAGADIVGLLVGQEHASTDFIDKNTAKKLCQYVNKRCDVSLVTHLTDGEKIIELSKFIGNNYIQLHSYIQENEVAKIHKALPDVKLVRLIHLSKDGEVLTKFQSSPIGDFYFLDSVNLQTNQVGGTGLVYDWQKAGEVIKSLNKPTFVAGGLTPENVAEAIIKTRCYGVDVNSGCKNANGIKDKTKVKQFVKNAKGCK